MLGFVPLLSNGDLSRDSTSNVSMEIETKEAATNKWFLRYNEALNNHRDATTTAERCEVISKYTELIPRDVSSASIDITPSMQLGVLKNLALLQEEVGDMEGAVASVAAATDVDESDVGLWYRLSNLAVKTDRLRLAKHALECALWTNPRHLPSLHKLPKVINMLNMHEGRHDRGLHPLAHEDVIDVSLNDCSWHAVEEVVLSLISCLNGHADLVETPSFRYVKKSATVSLLSNIHISLMLGKESLIREGQEMGSMEVETTELLAGGSLQIHNETEKTNSEAALLKSSQPIEVVGVSQAADSQSGSQKARRSQRQESRRVAATEAKENRLDSEFLGPVLELLGDRGAQISEDVWWDIGQLLESEEEEEVTSHEDQQAALVNSLSFSSNEETQVAEFVSSLHGRESCCSVFNFLHSFVETVARVVTSDVLNIDSLIRGESKERNVALGLSHSNFLDSKLSESLTQAASFCGGVLSSSQTLSNFTIEAELLLGELAIGKSPEVKVDRLTDIAIAKIHVLLPPLSATQSRYEVLLHCRRLLLESKYTQRNPRGLFVSSQLLLEAAKLLGKGCLHLPYMAVITPTELHNEINKLNTLDVVPQLRDQIADKFRLESIAQQKAAYIAREDSSKTQQMDLSMDEFQRPAPISPRVLPAFDFKDGEDARILVLKQPNSRNNIHSLFNLNRHSVSVLGLVMNDLLVHSPSIVGASAKRINRQDVTLLSCACKVASVSDPCAIREEAEVAMEAWADSQLSAIGHMSLLGLWLQTADWLKADELILFIVSCINKTLQSGLKHEGAVTEIEAILRILVIALWKSRSASREVGSHLPHKLAQCLVSVLKLFSHTYSSIESPSLLNLCLACAYLSRELVQQTVSRGLVGILVQSLYQSLSTSTGSLMCLCIHHIRHLAAPWTITSNLMEDEEEDSMRNEAALECLGMQRTLFTALTAFLSQVAEVETFSSPAHKLMLSLRAPCCTLLIWLLLPVEQINNVFSSPQLLDIYPSLHKSKSVSFVLSRLIDEETRFDLCGVLRDFMIQDIKLGETEPSEGEKDEIPMLALLELVCLDLSCSLPLNYPSGFLGHDEKVSTDEEGILVARLNLVCSLVRDIFHIKLLPYLDDHRLKWRASSDHQSTSSTHSKVEVRGSNWSLPMPVPLIERIVKFMLPVLIAHEEICRDSAFVCPCWGDLLPSQGFPKAILDDQRLVLQALFRSESYWWPLDRNNYPVIDYLFRDSTPEETLAHASELGRVFETHNISIDQEVIVRQHLYRLIVERVSAQTKSPDTNKEHESLERENSVLCRAALFALCYEPTNTDCWQLLSESFSSLVGLISNDLDASIHQTLGLSPEATQAATCFLLREMGIKHLLGRNLDRTGPASLSTYPSTFMAIKDSTCLLYFKDTDNVYYRGMWNTILEPLKEVEGVTNELVSGSVLDEIGQLRSKLNLYDESVPASREESGRQREALAALFIHGYRQLSLRCMSAQTVCYAHEIGLKSWKLLSVRPLCPYTSAWSLEGALSGQTSQTQIELSAGCGWEVEAGWRPPSEGSAARPQLIMFVRCLELLCFTLFEGLQDYPRATFPTLTDQSQSIFTFDPQWNQYSFMSSIKHSDVFVPLTGHLAVRGCFPHHSSTYRAWRELRKLKISEALALVELVCSVTVSPAPLKSFARSQLLPLLKVDEEVHEANRATLYQPGDLVEAKWRKGSLFYPGTVRLVNSPQNIDDEVTYYLDYDDGEQEATVHHSLVRPPKPFVMCLLPRSWGLTLLRAKLLTKQQESISSVDGWHLILSTYQAMLGDKDDLGEWHADPIDALSLLHRCRLKLVIHWLRVGKPPPLGIVEVLEAFPYNSSEGEPPQQPISDLSLEETKRRVLKVLNDCASAFEYCVAMSPYHHQSVVALASVLAERRRAEVVYAPSFTRLYHISKPASFQENATRTLVETVSMLEAVLGVSLRWQEGKLVVGALHKEATGSASDPQESSIQPVSLLDALSLCGSMFPDRKAKHAKNKLKLRRSSRPSISSVHSFSEVNPPVEHSSRHHTVHGFGFGLNERAYSVKVSPGVSWIDHELKVGDVLVSINGSLVDPTQVSMSGKESLHVKILRHNPLSAKYVPSSLTQSSDESSTQTRTQMGDASSDSEGMSDLDDGLDPSPGIQKDAQLADSIDIDVKTSVGASESLSSLHRLFAKKVPQIVGMWIKDSPESLWEELCARRRNFDKLRLNYTAHFVSCLTNGRNSSGHSRGEFIENVKQSLETLEKVLGYALSVKENRRDRISGLLTATILSGVVDTLVTYALELSGVTEVGNEVNPVLISELKSLLSNAYDKYLVSTDPSIFPVHINDIEKRCTMCLTLIANLFQVHTKNTLLSSNIRSKQTREAVLSEWSDTEEPTAKRPCPDSPAANEPIVDDNMNDIDDLI